MPGSIRVFVNERPVTLPAGASALDAARVLDPALGEGLAAGTVSLTDARGLPVDPDGPLVAGAILRTVARRAPGPDADA